MNPCQVVEIPLLICQFNYFCQLIYSVFFLTWTAMVSKLNKNYMKFWIVIIPNEHFNSRLELSWYVYQELILLLSEDSFVNWNMILLWETKRSERKFMKKDLRKPMNLWEVSLCFLIFHKEKLKTLRLQRLTLKYFYRWF